MNKPAKLIVKADGAILQTLEPGQKAKLEAKASTRYRVLLAEQADKADKADEAAQAEALAAQVLASRHGDDLQLDYADGSQLQLERFFQVCQGAQGSACAVELPAANGGTQLLGGDSASGAASSGQGYALYAYGASSEMAGLLQAQGLNTEGLKGLSQDGDLISYLRPSDGFNWAWLAPLALVPLVSSPSPVPTVIKGSVVAGPVLTGNGLIATAYKADGSVLASGAVNEDGSFTLMVGNDYKGPVLVRVSDSSDAADYLDEATGAPKDLGPDLRALAVVPAPGTYNISVNVLTELAVRQLGLPGGDNGTSENSFGGFSPEQIQAANQQVASAVGLEQDLVLGAPAVAIVTTGGDSNAQANDYGRLLAAISGAEVGSSTDAVLNDLVQKLDDTAGPGLVLEVLLEGAAQVALQELVDQVSDITSQKSAQVSIDPVAVDNRLSADEMAAGVTVSGTAAANASVTIEWSDASSGGQSTGSRSVTSDAQGKWSVTFTAVEMPALGATSLKASIGSAVATRSIYLDEPAAPVVTLRADTGNSASDRLTNDVRVDVSGYVDGWDYSTDGGQNWTAGQGSSFIVSGDGAQNLQVRQNIGGHFSASASLGFTLDTLAPTVLVSSDKSALKAGETATITFTLSEVSSDFTADDVVVSGGQLSNFQGSGTSYSATFTPTADSNTSASIYVASDKFADAAGNLNADGDDTNNSVSMSVDTVRPTMEVSSDKTALKAGETATITFTFSEDPGNSFVWDGSAGDVAVSGGSLGAISGGGLTRTATFTPTLDSTTAASISVGSSTFTDAAGNDNVDGADANNAVAMTVDTLRPTVSITSDATALKAGETATITFTFSEDPGNSFAWDGSAGDVAVSGGSLGAISGSGLTRTATFTPTPYSNTPASISVASTKFSDTAGNDNVDGADANNAVSMTVDTLRPIVAITSDVTALKAGETATITFTFSEDPGNSFAWDGSTGDVAVSGGSLGAISGSGLTRTATFTPTPDSTTAASISVASDKLADAAGNLNADGDDTNNSVSMSVDTVRPTIAVSSDVNALKAGETATITFTLSEASADFTADDLTVAGGTLGTLTPSGTDSKVYTATFTPTPDSTTAASISVASDKFADAAGNQNEDGADSNNKVAISIDTVRPTIEVNSDKIVLNIGETATITFALSEASNDFTADDVAVSGGTLSAFKGSGTSYSATFTPTANSTTAASISVASDKFADAAGNLNADGGDTNNNVSIKVDTVAPTVAGVELSDLELKVGETAKLTVSFSEQVTGFSASDVTVEAGSLGEFTSQDGGLSWSATLTPTAGLTLEKSKINVGSGYADLSGNDGTGGDYAGPAVDTLAPTVLSIKLSDDALKKGDTATATITFSEAVQGFAAEDVSTLNASYQPSGSLGTFTSQDNGITWTATFTPSDDIESPTNALTVLANSYSDAAGNFGSQRSSDNYAVDTLLAQTAQGAPFVTPLGEDGSWVVTRYSVGSLAELVSKGFAAMDATLEIHRPDGSMLDPVHIEGIAPSNLNAAMAAQSGAQGITSIFPSPVTALADGGFLVTSGNPQAKSWQVRRYDAAGEMVGVALDFPAGFIHPQAVAVGDGYVVAYQVMDSGSSGHLELQWFDSEGDGSTPVAVQDSADAFGFTLVADPAGGGNVYVGWTEGNLSGNGTSDNKTHIVSCQPTGAQSAVDTSSTISAGPLPSLLPVSDGSVVRAWSDTIPSGFSDTFKTYLKTTQFTEEVVNAVPGNVKLLALNDQDSANGATGSFVFSVVREIGNKSELVLMTLDTQAKSLKEASTVKIIDLPSQSNGEAGMVYWYLSSMGSSGDYLLACQTDAGVTVSRFNLSGVEVSSTQLPPDSNYFLTGLVTTSDGYVLTGVNMADSDGSVMRFDAAGQLQAGPHTVVEGGDPLALFGSESGTYYLVHDSVTVKTLSDITGAADGKWNAQTLAQIMTVTGYSLSTDGLVDGSYRIYAQDDAGNFGLATTRTYRVDVDVPVVELGFDQASLKAGETAQLTVQFSEAVTGFNARDLFGTGGEISDLVQDGSDPLRYSATFTPDANYEGQAKVELAAGLVSDLVGHVNAQSQVELMVDTLRPKVEISSNKSALKAGETATVTFTFSEDPGDSFAWDGSAGDLVVVGGTLGALSGSGLTRTATFTPTADSTTAASISVASSKFSDAAGNQNADGDDTNMSVDTLRPTVTISSNKTALKAGETATVTFSFSEDPGDSFAWDGSAGDLVVVGGTLGALSGSGLTRTATFTPTADSTAAASISVASSKFSDAAGNQNADGADIDNAVAISIDTLVPLAPGLSLEVDTGSSAKDGLTSNGQLNVTGLEADASWQYSLDGGDNWIDGNGTTIAASVLGADGTKTIKVRQTDAAGNVSEVQSLDFTLDTTKPATPDAALVLDLDGITNNGAMTAPTNTEAGAQVEYRVKKGDGTFSAWSETYTAPATDGTADGLYAVEVRQTDEAGNVSASEAISFTLDSSKPAMPDAALTFDSGDSASDGLTNSGALIAPTNIEAGAQVEYRVQKDGGTFSAWSTSYSAPATDGSADGAYQVEVRQTDEAGNVSASEAISFTLDSSKPAMPDAALTTDSSNGGAGFGADGITTSGAISAPTNTEASAKVEYRVQKDGGSFSAWSTSYSAPATDGTYQVEVRQTDASGNVSASQSISYTLDSQAPATPDAALTSDSGNGGAGLDADGISNSGALTAPTNTETDAKVEYRVKGPSDTEFGSWSDTYTAPVADGSADGAYQVEVRQTDAAGNVSASQSISYTLDATVPVFSSGQTATPIQENSGAGQLIYTAATNDVANLSYSLKADNSDDAISFSIDASTGEVTLTADPDYEKMTSYRFTVVATDAAGNAAEQAVSLAITDLADMPLDTTPPAAPLLSAAVQKAVLPFNDLTTVVQEGSTTTQFSHLPPSGLTDLSVRLEGDIADLGNNLSPLPFALASGARGADGTDDFLVSEFGFFGDPTTFGVHGSIYQTIAVGSGDDYARSLSSGSTFGYTYVAGESVGVDGTKDFSVVRVNIRQNSNPGQLDTRFSDDGKLIVPIGAGNDVAYNVIMLADGGALLSGTTESGNGDLDAAVVKVLPNGELDPAFGNGGKLVLPLSGQNDHLNCAQQLPDGGFMLVGTRGSPAGQSSTVLVRLDSTGALDATWGNQGVVDLSVGDLSGHGRSVVVDGKGQIVVTGYVLENGQADAVIWRLNADGTLKADWGSAGVLRITEPGDQYPGVAELQTSDSDVVGKAGSTLVVASTIAEDGASGISFISVDVKGDSYSVLSFSSSLTDNQAGYTVFVDANGKTSESFGRVYRQGDAPTALSPLLDIRNDYMNMESSGPVVTVARSGGVHLGDHFSLSASSGWALASGAIKNGSGTVVGQYVQQNGSLEATFNHDTADYVVSEFLRQLAYSNDESLNSHTTVPIDITINDHNSSASIVTRTVYVEVMVPGSQIVKVAGLEAGATWEYSTDSGLTWASGSGDSFVLGLSDSEPVRVRQTDTAGNVSEFATIDITKPATPDAALTIDSGNDASDGITSSGALSAPGNAEADAKVEYRVKGPRDTDFGSWSDTYTAPATDGSADGAYQVEVRQTDAAGNVSISQAIDFTLDNSKPAAPDAALATDAGSNASDGLTNSGVLTAPTNTNTETDAKVEYRVKGPSDSVFGSWSETYTAPAVDGTADGQYAVELRQTDAAGNVSEAQSLSFTLDASAPVIVTTSPLDGATNVGPRSVFKLTFDEAVALGTGEIRIVDDGGGSAGSTTTIAITDSSRVSVSGNTISIDPGITLQLNYSYYIEIDSGAITDLAGNAYAGIADAATWDFRVPDPAISLDACAGDDIVNALENAAPITFSGTLSSSAGASVLTAFAAADVTVTLKPAGGGADVSAILTNYDSATGDWTATLAANSLADGKQYGISVSADNGSLSTSATGSIQVDTSVSAPGLSLASDTGSDASDGITKDGSIKVSGLEVGASWEYSTDGGSSWQAGVGASFKLPSDGSHDLRVRQTDAAGNSSESSAALAVVLDSVAPATPDATLTAATDDGGAIVAPTNPEAGATLEYRLRKDGVNVTSSNDGWSNSYQPPATNGSANGAYTLELRQTDAAGNASESQKLEFTLGPKYVPIELSAIATGAGGFVINGQGAFDYSGNSVSSAGDVNGDGLADLIVGASNADPSNDRVDAGSSYVVFGRSGTDAVELSAIAAGTGGFVINGQSVNDRSGYWVSGAGDVNGDGLADLIVGTYDNNLYADRSYVVFGRSGTGAVELSALGSNGFVINGKCAADQSGCSVSSAGDVNGDGLADLIVGARFADPTGGNDAGRSYVVYGRSGTNAVELTAVAAGSGGFVINGQSEGDWSGVSVSGAGDVNGDGLADLIVGANGANGYAGSSYVVFGRSGTGAVDLSALGSNGFVINGGCAADQSGCSVSSAGDVNGDGLADLIVGAFFSDPAAGNNAGRSYVVFGRSTGQAIDLSAVALGSGGFVINGQCQADSSGVSVSSAGDVNGDGLADLIVGAYLADPNGNRSSGSSYVVYGRSGLDVVDLSAVALGSGGFVINGQNKSDRSGFGVSSAGDVNGDGLADLIVGAIEADPNGNSNAGRSYVIFGATDGAFSQTAVDWLGTSGDDSQSDDGVAKTLVAGAGDDSLTATAASVLHGGAGNDSFTIGAPMITALQSPLGSGGNDGQLARLDGGSGLDTIALSGAGLTLDLTQISNQAAGDPEIGGRLGSIERIDLTGGNTLKLTASDIHDLAGMNSFNGINGWTGLADSVARHQLLVDGGVSDKLIASGSWAELAGVEHGGQTYRRLVQGNAELLVDADVTLDLTLAPGITGIAFGTVPVTQSGLLKQGDLISFEVTFSEAMFFGGGLATQLALDIGGTTVQANYDSGSGTNKWLFKYAVAAGLTDLDGISIGANAVSRPAGFPSMPAGTVRNASGVDAMFINDPVTANANWRVDSVVPVAPDATLTAAEDDGGAIVAPTNVEAGATLEYRLKKDGSNVTASNDGWSSSYQPPATNGTYMLELRQTDLAGNASPSTQLEFTLGPKYAPVELSAIAAGSGGFVINGQCVGDWSGTSVSGAGDVNGDGLADLIVGAPQADPIGTQAAGRSYVVFGRSGTEVVELSAIEAGSGGFMINGVAFVDQSGHSVSSAGDFNGDGLADLIVGAYGADPTSRTNAGRSYVVFGRSGTGVVELWAVGSNIAGFVINGHCADDWSGYSVSSAGDVNGDGLADLLVGAKNAESGNAGDAGRSYVVFGRSGSGVIELSAVAEGRGGFVINGRCTNDISGTSVSGAGDVNGDGLADLIVGANQADPSNLGSAGSSYVVFGRSGTSAVELSDIAAGTGGFVINGQCAGDQSGYRVSSAGDVNGDGLGDLIVGAYQANPSIFGPAGSSYVVFGRSGTSAVELSDIAAGTGGFVIKGQSASDQSGISVSSAGDVNGDGLADLIVGATGGDPDRRSDAGRSYVVFGRSAGAVIELSAVAAGSGGFVIKGQSATDQSGTSVASAGDVNGDGLADLIVGASGADPSGRGDAGRSYVIFGATDGAFAWTAVDQLGGSGVDVMSDGGVARTLVAGAGDDSLTATAASVLHGGAGNDSFTIGSAMITALQSAMGSGGNADRLARIDGGSGLDTIALSGSGLTLDLTRIANQAAGDPETGSRLSSIERIDLSGSGNNQLTLSAADVRDLAGMNLYNSDKGWTGLAASVGKHQLRVDGDAGDLVAGTGFWAPRGTAAFGGNTYAVYDSVDGSAQLLVNQAVTAQLPFPTVELSAIAAGEGGFVINGQGASDYSGYSVSSAGDVNGDGLTDLIIGARTSDPTNRTDAGRSYVIFGRTGQAVVELSALGTGGFVINGQCANDQSGFSVSGAGDVNGDGLADLIVGASGGDPANRTDAGRSYVVFGRTAVTTIELSALGASGFVINGQGATDQSGYSVSSAGDVNGDGLADLIVGARASDPINRTDAGRSYVVFGRTGQTAVELSAVAAGTGGFVINGQCGSDLSGTSVSSAGDVNGDGLADLIVGAPYGDPAAERGDAGRSYVIFGRTGQTAVELSTLGAGGFVINGQCAKDRSGMTVSGAGDVNGDGIADLIVGSATADSNAGRSYVVFGHTGTTPIELSSVALGTGGFVIRGQCEGDSSGASVSSAGDVNGDGLADLIVGAYNSASGAGRSYVVFGKSAGTAIDLSAVAAGQGGFVINGQCAGDLSGCSVSSAGDVNGDGLADLIVGAGWSAPTTGLANAGRSYVIFGSTDGAFSKTAVDWLGASGADSQSDGGVTKTLVAGAGDDTLTATAASVLYGGAGNDQFKIYGTMVQALQTSLGNDGNDGQLARIDGGGGVDKIVLQGASLNFDLTQITQSAMNPEGLSRLSGIEEIDITGSGDNKIKLTAKDVFDMGGQTNIYAFKNLIGGLIPRRELIVTGDKGDTLDLADGADKTGWTLDSGFFGAGYTYNDKVYYAYNFTASSSSEAPVVVLVQKDMTVI